jgi:hypothetical protein
MNSQYIQNNFISPTFLLNFEYQKKSFVSEFFILVEVKTLEFLLLIHSIFYLKKLVILNNYQR